MISSRVLVAKPRSVSTAKHAAKPEPLHEHFTTLDTHGCVSPAYGYSLAGLRIFASAKPEALSRPTPLPWPIQAKLEIGAVDDPLEREADSVAAEIMRMPERQASGTPTVSRAIPGVQRKCSCGGSCDDCKAKQADEEHGRVQRMPAAESRSDHTSSASSAPPIVHEVLCAPGQPLDPATRAFFEPRFGHDFSRIRVHTDAKAAESARAVNARAYTVGHQIVFGPGQYGHTDGERARLMAHELAHMVQQAALLHNPVLRRQPESTVHVGSTEKKVAQGTGGSGAIIYEYTARAMKEPPDKSDPKKPGKMFEIDLPLLVYPPANIDTTKSPPKVDIFVFFHGMRATYEEGTKTQASQGEEPIAIWSHLKDAVAASGRLGIAPQAPRTWAFSNKKGEWIPSTAQWYEALGKVGFDGLINIALQRLSNDLGPTTPLVAGDIHVAGHSAGGQGIIRATSHDAGAKTFSDQIQDLTLQDAGYGFDHWDHLMDWLLDGSPGKTVRVLVSASQGGPPGSGGDTRSVLNKWLNVSKINDSIKAKKKTATLEAVPVPVPKPEDQKPRPGGFVLESELVVNNKTAGVTQGTIVVFFSPGGKHYPTATASMAAAAAAGPKTTTDFLGEATPGKYRVIGDQEEKIPVFADQDLSKKPKLLLPRDTPVEVTALERKKPEGPKDKAIQPYLAEIKIADGTVGWVRLANLAKQ